MRKYTRISTEERLPTTNRLDIQYFVFYIDYQGNWCKGISEFVNNKWLAFPDNDDVKFWLE